VNELNKAILNYEDVEKDLELEIFGITFSVDFNKEYIEELKKLNMDEAGDDEFAKLRLLLDKILGDGSYKKIEDKYKSDNKKDMGLGVIVKIYTFIFDQYAKAVANIKNPNFMSYNKDDYRNNRNNNYNNRNSNYNNRNNYNNNRNNNYRNRY
jgi:hypothetical protein